MESIAARRYALEVARVEASVRARRADLDHLALPPLGERDAEVAQLEALAVREAAAVEKVLECIREFLARVRERGGAA